MAGEAGRVLEVIQQDGDNLVVSVPMAGFPPGFKIRPGERVVLMNDDGGPTVRPLVRAVEADAVDTQGDEARANNQRFALQPGTIRNTDPGAGTRPVVFVLDKGAASGPEQVLSIRPGKP
jgi:hypothetical protein